MEESGTRVARIVVVAAIVSAMAAAAGYGALRAGLPPWAMFLGWAAYYTGGGTRGPGVLAVASLALGLVIAMTTMASLQQFRLDAASGFLIALFVITFLALLCRLLPRVNNVLAVFLGVTAFFAARLAPGVSALVTLVGAACIGLVLGMVAIEIETRLGASR